jgi:hypothetical protein
MSDNVDPGPAEGMPQDGSEQLRPVVTRREFIAGAGAGVAVGAVVAGGIAVATRPAVQTQPAAVVGVLRTPSPRTERTRELRSASPAPA